MKNVYFLYQRIGIIITSIILAFLFFPYKKSEEMKYSNSVFDLFLFKIHKIFGEYGPFAFFIIVAVILIINEIILFKKKKNS